MSVFLTHHQAFTVPHSTHLLHQVIFIHLPHIFPIPELPHLAILIDTFKLHPQKWIRTELNIICIHTTQEGKCTMQETYFLLLEVSENANRASDDAIENGYNSFHRHEQRAFDRLTYWRQNDNATNERFLNNCFRVGDEEAPFLEIASINHSCVPNACFVWNASLQKGVVHALTKIPEGAEIFIAYRHIGYNAIDSTHRQQRPSPYPDRDSRRRMLNNCWVFNCQCRVCDDGPINASFRQNSDQCRALVLQHKQQYEAARQPGTAWKHHWLRLDLKTLNLLELEGLVHPDQAHAYRQCAEWCEDNLLSQRIQDPAVVGIAADHGESQKEKAIEYATKRLR